ncbi:MAG: pyridoxal-phosphate dependent enzyme [Acidobacteriota bacterium]
MQTQQGIAGAPRATMGEGKTPLVPSVIPHAPKAGQLFFKLESLNPTGSYKDRFVAVEVTRMLRAGVKACIATSSGNTGSALAAYCARYGLRCVILVNQDAPAGKLMQMQAHGAQVLRVPEFVSNPAVTSAVFALLQDLSQRLQVPLVVSAFRHCPEGMQGVEAIANELVSAEPDHVFVPVGGGGLYSAVVQGFLAAGAKLPRVHGVQPEGCLTMVASYLTHSESIASIESTTRISGLAVPMDIDASRALRLAQRCGGTGIAVSDDEVFQAQQMLMAREGIYAEPAGACAFAGWRRAVAAGLVTQGETSVCLVTGHGFKDPVSAERAAGEHPSLTAPLQTLEDKICGLLF